VFLKLICGKGRTRRFPSDNQWVGKGMGSSWSGEDGLGCSWATWMWVTNFPYFQSASKWFEISYLTIKIVKIIQRGEDRCVSQLSVTITNTLANHLRKRKGLFLAHSFGVSNSWSGRLIVFVSLLGVLVEEAHGEQIAGLMATKQRVRIGLRSHNWASTTGGVSHWGHTSNDQRPPSRFCILKVPPLPTSTTPKTNIVTHRPLDDIQEWIKTPATPATQKVEAGGSEVQDQAGQS
jgi:hypothetical protein